MDAASRRSGLAERADTMGVSYRKTAPRGNGATLTPGPSPRRRGGHWRLRVALDFPPARE